MMLEIVILNSLQVTPGQTLLGGVGHCCTWHVQVPSGVIGSYGKNAKQLVFPWGCQLLGVAGIPPEHHVN